MFQSLDSDIVKLCINVFVCNSNIAFLNEHSTILFYMFKA